MHIYDVVLYECLSSYEQNDKPILGVRYGNMAKRTHNYGVMPGNMATCEYGIKAIVMALWL